MPLRIRLFGELDVCVGDEPVPPPESARARSLLAYLVLHDGVPQSRQRLAFLLWPDSTESQARTNLRHLLHTLRSAVPAVDPYLDVTPQTLPLARGAAGPTWPPSRPPWPGRPTPSRRGEEVSAPCARPSGSTRATCWTVATTTGCSAERDRYRDRYTWAVRRLAGLLAARGDHAEAVPLGRELLRIDPLREDTYRLLMRVHDAAGDRAAAVRTYHECVSTLRRELLVEPSDDDEERLRRAHAHSRRGRSGRQRRRPRGPRGEWRRLASLWEDAERGRSHLVLVTGEPGIGKTRLVEEFAAVVRASVARRWRRAGRTRARASSATASCTRGYGRRPWPATCAGWPSTSGPSWPGCCPSWPPPDPDAGDAADQRRRLFEAVARALVAPGRPTLLVADDAQWCDGPSLRLLHYLIRLGTRPAAPCRWPPSAARTSRSPPPAQRDRRPPGHRQGHGGRPRPPRPPGHRGTGPPPRRPQPGARRGRRPCTPRPRATPCSSWRPCGPGGTARRSAPPQLQSVIDRPARARCRTPARDARWAWPPPSAGSSPPPCSPWPPRSTTLSLVRALDELWRRGLVREQGTDAYDFAHGRIREVAYEALAPAERRHNHLLIAAALAADVTARPGDIARHYDRAGRAAEAVAWYRRAAMEAQRLHAHVEAVRLLDRAARCWRRAAKVSGRCCPRCRRPSPSSRASPRPAWSRSSAGSSHREGSPSPSCCARSSCRTCAGATSTPLATWRPGCVSLAAGDHVLLVESEYLLGISAFWAGDFEAACDHFQTVDRRADPAQAAEHLLRFGHDPRPVCVSRLANTLCFLGDYEEAFPTADRAMAMAEELGHPFTAGVVSVFAALLAVDMNDTHRFFGYLDRMPDATGQQALGVAAEALQGFADAHANPPEAGIRRIRAAVQMSSVDHAPGQQATHLHLLVGAHELARDTAGGLAAVGRSAGRPRHPDLGRRSPPGSQELPAPGRER